MKKILTTLCMALATVAMVAQEPVITFERTEHDFGRINEGDGRVSTVFTFKNEGMSPLILSNVRASCGCTTPTWTKEPVEPGQSGSITVTYNPNGRPGRFQKTITITSNATDATKKVYIKGEVIPKQAKPENKYTLHVGELNMKSKTIELGTIKKGERVNGELEYANLSGTPHHVEIYTNMSEDYLLAQATLPDINPNETGKFVFSLDTKAMKLYGPVELFAYVVIDGKKDMSETFRLVLKGDIIEDFSQMSKEACMQAPIIEVAESIDLGVVAAGKTLKASIAVKNSGVDPLLIRRVYNSDNSFVFKPCKSVKSGKKGTIGVEISTKGKETGKYSREIVIISNDYKQPLKKVHVTWRIE